MEERESGSSVRTYIQHIATLSDFTAFSFSVGSPHGSENRQIGTLSVREVNDASTSTIGALYLPTLPRIVSAYRPHTLRQSFCYSSAYLLYENHLTDMMRLQIVKEKLSGCRMKAVSLNMILDFCFAQGSVSSPSYFGLYFRWYPNNQMLAALDAALQM